MNERTTHTQTHDYSKNAGYRNSAAMPDGSTMVIYNLSEYGFDPGNGKEWALMTEPPGRVFTFCDSLEQAEMMLKALVEINEILDKATVAHEEARALTMRVTEYMPRDFVHVKPHYMKKPFWAWVVAAGADWVEVEHWSFGYVTRHDLDEVTLANEKAPTAEAPSA